MTLTLLGGCATLSTSVRLQSDGALKGALATTINHQAWNYYQERHAWPDANKLARLAGLSVYNREEGNSFAVYILDKPYHSIPTDMDPSQTFAFYSYFCPTDSSYYTYCRIYYDRRSPHTFSQSSTDGDCAATYSLQLDAEEQLGKFYQDAVGVTDESALARIVHQYALKISEISPNPTAKQLLLEFTAPLLSDFYREAADLSGAEFQSKLEEYSARLGEYIHNQDWTQSP